MNKTLVINIVGLTPSLIGPYTPRLNMFSRTRKIASIQPTLPAVTCPVQATFLTGTQPNEHGIVGNGWYFRDECEIKFWRQSNKLVQRPKIWEAAKQLDPSFTCCNVGWWYNMESSADFTVTPRPIYTADGRKIPDCYTQPPQLRDKLQKMMGQFPLFQFWGPATTIDSSRWLAEAAIQIDRMHNPTLTLVYVPHLDYALQRVGPDVEKLKQDLRETDGVFGQLFDYFSRSQTSIIVVSEYGITNVSRPVHLNRVLREKGFLKVRDELGHELLDAGASAAFAVADHQAAHVYINDASRANEIRSVIEQTPGVAKIYDSSTKSEIHLDHPRAGDLVVFSDPDAWFAYYYWLEESHAPDFAHTVDIHRKPGYDPVELFIDPKIRLPKLRIATRLLKRKLGMRALMDVIGTDASIVRGSHGVAPPSRELGPLLIGDKERTEKDSYDATEVYGEIWKALTNS